MKEANAIETFKPRKQYQYEKEYHDALFHALQVNFPSINYEEQSGSSRPDLVISNIAFKIKEPTYNKDLETIANKLLRYPQHYDNLIIVLFDLHASDSYYREWKNGLMKHHPNIVLIVK